MIYCHENTQRKGAGFSTKKTIRRKRCSWQSPCFRVGRTATSGTYTRRWIAANWEGENSPLDTSVGWLWHRAQKPPAQRSPQPSCTRARRAPSYYGETGNLRCSLSHSFMISNKCSRYNGDWIDWFGETGCIVSYRRRNRPVLQRWYSYF